MKKERNAWDLERDDLKDLARFTRKGELQSRIDRKNEEIDILKTGLSGIARKYGYQNVQEFYHTYHQSHSAYAAYRDQAAEWENIYGENAQRQRGEVTRLFVNKAILHYTDISSIFFL